MKTRYRPRATATPAFRAEAGPARGFLIRLRSRRSAYVATRASRGSGPSATTTTSNENVAVSRRAIPSRHRCSMVGRANVGTITVAIGELPTIRDYHERRVGGD